MKKLTVNILYTRILYQQVFYIIVYDYTSFVFSILEIDYVKKLTSLVMLKSYGASKEDSLKDRKIQMFSLRSSTRPYNLHFEEKINPYSFYQKLVSF